jgi:hypothetical protein
MLATFRMQSNLQNITRKVSHIGFLCDALALSLQQCKEVALHSIPADASNNVNADATMLNKVVTEPQVQSNYDVTSFRCDMGTDGRTDQPTDGRTNQQTNRRTNQPT